MKKRVICRGPAARRLAREMGIHDAVAAVRLRGSGLIAELSGPPFALDAPSVLKAANVKEVREVANSSLDGRIYRNGSGYVIELNKKLAPARRAFTLAHEIAHTFFLGAEGGSERSDDTTGRFDDRNEEEYLCDTAAAEMLMPAAASIPGQGLPALGEFSKPKNAFLKRVVEQGPSVDVVLDLAKEFGASVTAAARRYADLTSEDLFLGFWRMKPTGETMFEFGFSSGRVELRVVRDSTLAPDTASRVAVEKFVAADIGLVNLAGDRVGDVLTQARGLRATGRIVTMSLLNDTARRCTLVAPSPAPAAPTLQRKLAF